MKRVVFASLAAAVVGVMASAGMRAQPRGRHHRNGTGTSVTITTVKPERVADWLEIQKSQTIPMQQKGGIKSRETWQSGAPFGEGNSYGIVTPIDKFATYDVPLWRAASLAMSPGEPTRTSWRQ